MLAHLSNKEVRHNYACDYQHETRIGLYEFEQQAKWGVDDGPDRQNDQN
jgi:hypothetical protein